MEKKQIYILAGGIAAFLVLAGIIVAVCIGSAGEKTEDPTGDVTVDLITLPGGDTEETDIDTLPDDSSTPEETDSKPIEEHTTPSTGETSDQDATRSTELPATGQATDPEVEPTVKPTEGSATEAVPKPTEGNTGESATKPTEQTATEHATKPTEQSATGQATDPAVEPTVKPTEGSAAEVGPKPTEGNTGETATKPTEQTATEPTVDSAQSPTEATGTKPGNESGGETVKESYAVIPMQYPTSSVKKLSERMISLSSFCARAAGESNYLGNRHYTGTNVVISPYFTATVDQMVLPVYAAPVYVATGNYGALHSYASVDVDFGSHESIVFTIEVDGSVEVSSVQVYAQDKAVVSCSGRTISLEVYTHGVYTVVLNDKQDHAVTFMVRQYRDEDAEIAAYIAKYGSNNVIVYEPGIHEISYQLLNKDNMVLYLKAGAILLPKHTIDIMSDGDAANQVELGAKEANGIGLNRYPVISAHNRKNVVIAGRGTVDMTQLDWHERRGIVFTMCENVTVDGVIIINPCEWSFITYRCENVCVTQSAVLGYRTNSDAFAICNSVDVTVSDCFARTGDDMFEVKTLGGVDTAVSENITFSRCQAWGSKARCFGVIGEIEKNVTDILFEDSIVIFRDAIWDNNRIGSLVVLRECGNGVVDGVTFRNITIHYDRGRAINVGVYSSDLSDSKMTGITFENITYHAEMNSQLRLNGGSGNVLRVKLRNVSANGTRLTSNNIENYFYWDVSGLHTVE